MSAEPDLSARVRRLVEDLGLGHGADITAVTPLSGGVASDIALVAMGERRFCVKFALEKLKVAAEWHAPIRRNRAEYAWLAFAATVAPRAVPALFGWSAAENGFAMAYCGGPDIVLWKSALLGGQVPAGEAETVGDVIGRIHAASRAPSFDASSFQNAEDFRALRLEPYLGATAARHPALAARIEGLAEDLDAARDVLVHGDVSPKNILFDRAGAARPGRPILLDAECATMGDASFDIAFCLNHLALKAVHLQGSRAGLFAAMHGFWNGYRPHLATEAASALEARVAALLPVLMLARIDGKSPVEYLGPDERVLVRRLAIPLIAEPRASLAALTDTLQTELLAHG